MAPVPYYDEDGITIYHGDCLDVLPSLTFDVVVTDPPYGIDLNTDYSRPSTPASRCYPRVLGDDEPFDPAHLTAYPRVVMFGANHYAERLPPSRGWVVWDKITRNDVTAGQISDAELAWTNCLPRTRVFRHMWNGGFRASERDAWHHPTQKPVALMSWLLDLVSKPGEVVCDPYMGSGPTLRAAKDLGRRAIGVELSEAYCEIAAKRLAQGVLDFGAAV